jgi:hypothetical protein
MSWNYRIVRNGDEYGIHEVYYDAQGTPHSLSEKSVVPVAGSPDDLRERLEMVLRAFQDDVLSYESLEVGPPAA